MSTAQHPNPHAAQWMQFEACTTEHQLTVVHDDGLYRHLRMAKPGTGIWSWNVVTWPWHLYVGGDIGQGYVFSREEDMIGFFQIGAFRDYYGDGSPSINPQYWAEKLDRACIDSAESYDRERFTVLVREHIADALLCGEMDRERAKELRLEIPDVADFEETAREWLGSHPDEFPDSWEWHLKGWDHHYLLACYAVATTVPAYRTPRATT